MINSSDEKGRCLCDSKICRIRRSEIPYGLITQAASMFGGTGILLVQFLGGGHPDSLLTLVGLSMMGLPIFKESLPAKEKNDPPEKDDLTLAWLAADGPTHLAKMLETDDAIERLEIEDEIDYRLGIKKRPTKVPLGLEPIPAYDIDEPDTYLNEAKRKIVQLFRIPSHQIGPVTQGATIPMPIKTRVGDPGQCGWPACECAEFQYRCGD
jgi:hypothetical protein